MKINQFKNILITICSFTSIGCVSSKKIEFHKPNAEILAGQSITAEVADDIKADSFIEIEFKPGNYDLNKASKKAIKLLINQPDTIGNVDEILVLSWADEEYPSKEIKKLSINQIKLAEDRNKAVAKYIGSLRFLNVRKYNLAERPDLISQWFNTTDAKLKSSLINAGLPTTANELQYPSKAGHSIIILKLKKSLKNFQF